jgi:hypothetical protein
LISAGLCAKPGKHRREGCPLPPTPSPSLIATPQQDFVKQSPGSPQEKAETQGHTRGDTEERRRLPFQRGRTLTWLLFSAFRLLCETEDGWDKEGRKMMLEFRAYSPSPDPWPAEIKARLCLLASALIQHTSVLSMVYIVSCFHLLVMCVGDFKVYNGSSIG